MSGSRSILEICVCACVCAARSREWRRNKSEAFKIFLCARVSQESWIYTDTERLRLRKTRLSYDVFVEWASRTCLFIYAFKHNLTRRALFSSVFFFFSVSLLLSFPLCCCSRARSSLPKHVSFFARRQRMQQHQRHKKVGKVNHKQRETASVIDFR